MPRQSSRTGIGRQSLDLVRYEGTPQGIARRNIGSESDLRWIGTRHHWRGRIRIGHDPTRLHPVAFVHIGRMSLRVASEEASRPSVGHIGKHIEKATLASGQTDMEVA